MAPGHLIRGNKNKWSKEVTARWQEKKRQTEKEMGRRHKRDSWCHMDENGDGQKGMESFGGGLCWKAN